LTAGRLLGTVNRFREYPEPAVRKRLGGRLAVWPALYWIQEMFHRVWPDGRGWAGSSVVAYAYLSRLRHPPPQKQWDPMRTGYVGRNSETELGRWETRESEPMTSTTVDCYFA
jgi:hypothetical protein